MRVLHITRDFPPRLNGGISTAVGGMVVCSRRLGIECAVVSFDAWRPRVPAKSIAPAPVVHDDADGMPLMRLSHPEQLAAAHTFAEHFRPAVLHVHHGMLWSFAARLRDQLAAPAILQIHVVQAAQNRLRGVRGPTLSATAQTEALRAADVAVAPTHAAARMLFESYPGPCCPVRVIGLGIDDSEAARTAVANRSPGGPALYVGRFADINGTAELLAAIPAVLAQVPDAHFVIAGGVPDNPKAERRWHRRWRDRTPESIRARVTWPGWQSRADLAALYGRAGVLMAPSWLETFGLVVLEAMLYGLPIAATRSGGVEELIDHGRTGLLSAPRQVDALVANLVELLTQPERALALGRTAARAVRAERLWSHIAGELECLYGDVLHDRLRPPRVSDWPG